MTTTSFYFYILSHINWQIELLNSESLFLSAIHLVFENFHLLFTVTWIELDYNLYKNKTDQFFIYFLIFPFEERAVPCHIAPAS